MPEYLEWSIPVTHSKNEIPGVKNHTASLVGHKLFVFGGYLENNTQSNKMHVFDCTTYEWKTLRNVAGHVETARSVSFPLGRNGHTATVVGKNIWIIGGWTGREKEEENIVWVFDTVQLQWTKKMTISAEPISFNMHSAAYSADDNSIYVFRGADGTAFLSDLHRLDLKTLQWERRVITGHPIKPRAGHGCAISNGVMYIFGGWNGKTRLDDFFWFNYSAKRPTAQQILKVGNPSPRSSMGMEFVGNKIYIFGGLGENNESLSDLHVFDTLSSKWLSLSLHVNKSESENKDRKKFIKKTEPVVNPSMGKNDGRLELLGKGPGEMNGLTMTAVHRKLILFGGGCNLDGYGTFYNTTYELDLDSSPEIRITRSISLEIFQTSLAKFYRNKKFCDVDILVEGKALKAHKLVLSMMSKTFEGMFQSPFQESTASEIKIIDSSYVAVKAMLHYIYTGRVPVFKLISANSRKFVDKLRRDSVPLLRDGGDADEVSLEEALDLEDIFNDDSVRETGDQDDDKDLLANRQTNGYENLGFVLEDVLTVLELLRLSDVYGLDHLKQICEKMLESTITRETVEDIIKVSELAEARQLLAKAIHFKRNYGVKDNV